MFLFSNPRGKAAEHTGKHPIFLYSNQTNCPQGPAPSHTESNTTISYGQSSCQSKDTPQSSTTPPFFRSTSQTSMTGRPKHCSSFGAGLRRERGHYPPTGCGTSGQLFARRILSLFPGFAWFVSHGPHTRYDIFPGQQGLSWLVPRSLRRKCLQHVFDLLLQFTT